MKHIAQFKVCEQVSPDDWALNTYTLELTHETTIKEVIEWAHKRDAVNLPEIKILRVEQLPRT